MSLGKELLQRRSELIETERKLNEQHNREVEAQWRIIKYTIDNTEITKDLKYIDLGYFPDIAEKNIMKLHNEDFIVFQDRNKCIRLYLSKEDYKNDITTKLYKSINSNKKSDFKINNNKQVEYDNDFKINIAGADEVGKNDFAEIMDKCIKAMVSRRDLRH